MSWRARPSPNCARRDSNSKKNQKKEAAQMPARPLPLSESSEALEHCVGAGDFRLAGRFLDVERLHDAVLDQHRIALGAQAETVARRIERKVDGLGEIAVAVGQELD